MATATTSQATNHEYRIQYSIHDGENEYMDEITAFLPKRPETHRELTEAVLGNWIFTTENKEDKEKIERAVKEYKKDGCFELPNDYRIIDDIQVIEDMTAQKEALGVLKSAARARAEDWESAAEEGEEWMGCPAIGEADKAERREMAKLINDALELLE